MLVIKLFDLVSAVAFIISVSFTSRAVVNIHFGPSATETWVFKGFAVKEGDFFVPKLGRYHSYFGGCGVVRIEGFRVRLPIRVAAHFGKG
jgi:hypothetical protein